MAEVIVYRTEYVRKAVRFTRVDIQLLIEFVEGFLRGLLVVEHLDDLLTVDHFFDVAVYFCDGGLLCDEELAALSGDLSGYHHHKDKRYYYESRKRETQDTHRDENRDYRYKGRECLRDALREHLTERVYIVRVMAHDVAVGIAVEIAYRKSLHLLEHLVAYRLLNALRDSYHYAVLKESAYHAYEVYAAHLYECPDKRHSVGCKAGFFLRDHSADVVVYELFEEQRSRNARESVDYDADEYHKKPQLIVLEYVTDKALERFRVKFHAAAAYGSRTAGAAAFEHHGLTCFGFSSFSRHYSSPPFASEAAASSTLSLPFCCDSYTSR